MKKKINFKQKKYILPLVCLPFVLFIAYSFSSFFEEKEEVVDKELSTSLGEVEETLLNKDEAYDRLFNNEKDGRTMIGEIGAEEDSLMGYTDNLSFEQKRYIDSLKMAKNPTKEIDEKITEFYKPYNNSNNNYSKNYDKPQTVDKESEEILKILNSYQNPQTTSSSYYNKEEKEEEYNPTKALREQMLFLDSIQKTQDPEYKAQLAAEKKLKADKEKLNNFLNSTVTVTTQPNKGSFNSIQKNKNNNVIKAVIDQNMKGVLGSRVRFRLLDDIYIGNNKLSKGTLLFGEISGFATQRVYLSIVSIFVNGDIKPVNLSVFDMDGIKGVYVPSSIYRDMMKQLGQQSSQGITMGEGAARESFFQSMFMSMFRSTSQTLINLIQKQKVSLKYNSHIYLINEQNLNQDENK